MYRVRRAYELTPHQADDLLQSLWPHAAFPLELWRQAYGRFWQDFAQAEAVKNNVACPLLSDIVLEAGKAFHTELCALDVMTFFRKLSLCIDSGTLPKGLEYILAETFDSFDDIFPNERARLFSTLHKLERRAPSYDVFDVDNMDDELLCLPVSSYHFISHIFFDTILVDRIAAILELRHYPLLQDVKGITRAFVDSILTPATEETPTALEISAPQAEQESEAHSPAPQEQAPVPRSTGSKKGSVQKFSHFS